MMVIRRVFIGMLFILINVGCNGQDVSEAQPLNKNKVDSNNYKKLTTEEERVIINKGTEYPYSGAYNDFKDSGQFVCKQCNTPLFTSDSKFDSRSGWPSFDDAIDNNVKEILDADGKRSEIVCNTCGGHLGHVFRGEGFTDKDTRHCVNSISLDFVPKNNVKQDTAIFASGCFWGTEYHLQKFDGVIDTKPGYIGGEIKNPSYKQVCTGTTGHAEAVRVIFNPDKVSFEELAILYFETHDPSQVDRQGPDVGTQYRSEIFYSSESQKETSKKLIKVLEDKGVQVATKLSEATTFWVAEDYHQDYYIKTGKQPYCHIYQKKF